MVAASEAFGVTQEKRSMWGANASLFVLACLLFFSGSALAATGFSRTAGAAILLSVLCSGVLIVRNRPGPLLAARIDWRWLASCLAIALAVSLLGGQGGHLVFPKDDWLLRDGVLADLSAHWLPVIYSIDGGEYFLRAPIGMYLLPAAFGHVFGLSVAHFAQLAQNTVLLGAFLYIVTLAWPKHRLAVALLFLLYAGASVIPVLLMTEGGWLPHYLVFWTPYWNYPSNLTQYLWNPNHALPGWWFAALAVLFARREIDLATLAGATTPMALWSPLTLVAAGPIFAVFALQAPRQMLTTRFALACLGLIAYLPVLAYLSLGANKVVHKWLVFEPDFIESYVLLVTFALPLAYFTATLSVRLDPPFRRILLASFALLLSLPVYFIGVGDQVNDFSQKASIIPQSIVALAFATLLIEFLSSREWLLGGAALALIAIAAVEPALETYDSLTNKRFAASDCNLTTVWWKTMPSEQFPATYLARVDAAPAWLKREGKPVLEESRRCWPDRQQGERRFHYMNPENLIWLRARP